MHAARAVALFLAGTGALSMGRVFPRTRDEYDYAPFFATLRVIGYDKRISVEASTRDLAADAPLAIALLRRAFQP